MRDYRHPMTEQDDAGALSAKPAKQPTAMPPQQPPMPYSPLQPFPGSVAFTQPPMVLPNPSSMTSGGSRMFQPSAQHGGPRPRLGPMMNPMMSQQPGGFSVMSQQPAPVPMAAAPPPPGAGGRAVYAYPMMPTSQPQPAARMTAPAVSAPGQQARYNPLATAAAAVATAEGVVLHVDDPPPDEEKPLSPKAQRKLSHNAVEARRRRRAPL